MAIENIIQRIPSASLSNPIADHALTDVIGFVNELIVFEPKFCVEYYFDNREKEQFRFVV